MIKKPTTHFTDSALLFENRTDQENLHFTRRNFLRLLGISSSLALLPASLLATPLASGMVPVKESPKAIPTATGQIFPDQMGITSLHEHIPFNSDPILREKSKAYAIRDLKKAKALGLNTIMDVGPTDDVRLIKEVSEESGINIVCCTGSYLLKDDQLLRTVEDFEKQMIKDIEEGIQGTQIRPGVIKVAARTLPILPGEKNLFIAAAHVQKRYKLPICAHAVSGCAEQQQILEAAGADLKHCYFSHIEATFGWSGRTVEQEIDYLQRVIEKGSTLSFNNFGNWNHTKPEDLALIINELTRRGFDDYMVATMDTTWSFKDGDINLLWGDTNEAGKDRTYSYLLQRAVPWMKENGVPEKSIHKFIKDNPQRIFSWS